MYSDTCTFDKQLRSRFEPADTPQWRGLIERMREAGRAENVAAAARLVAMWELFELRRIERGQLVGHRHQGRSVALTSARECPTVRPSDSPTVQSTSPANGVGHLPDLFAGLRSVVDGHTATSAGSLIPG